MGIIYFNSRFSVVLYGIHTLNVLNHFSIGMIYSVNSNIIVFVPKNVVKNITNVNNVNEVNVLMAVIGVSVINALEQVVQDTNLIQIVNSMVDVGGVYFH